MIPVKTKYITDNAVSKIAKFAINANLLSDDNPTAVFFSQSKFESHLDTLVNEFSPNTLHAISLKANPVINILKIAAEKGFGAECASTGEVLVAERAGFDHDSIVYDSPTKTKNEIIYALQKGIYLNIDNEQELDLIDSLIKQGQSFRRGSIGIRINPELSLNDYDQHFTNEEQKTITGLKTSKFGIPLNQAEKVLKDNGDYKKIITGLHLHIGSQKCPVEMIIHGIKKVVEMAEMLNDIYGYDISTIDIGGGLAVRYEESDNAISFKDFSAMLFSEIPQLKKYRIITEFGRSVFAEMGVVISKVEYTKWVSQEDGQQLKIALTQTGGDMFVRTAYMSWYHDIMLLNRDGSIKEGGLSPQDIAGPLCFSGDFIGHKRYLPSIEPGDWIVVRNAGAYTFSMWSNYNSRAFPPIYGFDDDFNFSVLHKGRSSEEVASLWE